MEAIRITQKLESSTLHLPQLQPLVGQYVEIVVLACPPAEMVPGIVRGTEAWAAAQQAANEIEDYDFEAAKDLDEADLRDNARQSP